MTPGNGDRDFDEAGLLDDLGEADPEVAGWYREMQAKDERAGSDAIADPSPEDGVGEGGGADRAPVAADGPSAGDAEAVPVALLGDVEELLSKPLSVPDAEAGEAASATEPGGLEGDGPDAGSVPEPEVGGTGDGAGEPAGSPDEGVAVDDHSVTGDAPAAEADEEPVEDAREDPPGGPAAGADAVGRPEAGDAGEGASGEEPGRPDAPEEEGPGAGEDVRPDSPEEAVGGSVAADGEEQGDDAAAASVEEAPGEESSGARDEEQAGPARSDETAGEGFVADDGDQGDDAGTASVEEASAEEAEEDAAGAAAGGADEGPAGGLVERVLDHDEAFNRDILTWLEAAGTMRRAREARGIDDAKLDEELGPGGRFLLDAWFALNGVRVSAEIWEHWMQHVRRAMDVGRRHWSGRVVELLEMADVELGRELGVDGDGGGWRDVLGELLAEVLPAAELAKYRERVRRHADGETDHTDRALSVIDNLTDEYVGMERQQREGEELRRVRSELDSVKLDPTWRVAANHQLLREPGLAAFFRRCAAVPGIGVEVPAIPAGTQWVRVAEQPFVWTEAPGREVSVNVLPAAVVVLGRDAWEARAQQLRGRGPGGRPGPVRSGRQVAMGVVLGRVEAVAFQVQEPGRGIADVVEVTDVETAAAAVAAGRRVELSVLPVGGLDWLRPAAGGPEVVLPAVREALGVERVVGVVMVTGAEGRTDLVKWYARSIEDSVWVPVVMSCGEDVDGAALCEAFERVSGYDGMGIAGGGPERR